MTVSINDNLNQKDKSLIKAKINKNKYHLEIVTNKNFTIIEVHNKNFLLGSESNIVNN